MIRLGTREQFDTVRPFLLAAYGEDFNPIADRVGDFNPEKHHDEPALIRMFFLGRAISPSEWEAVAPEPVRAACSELGLIEPASTGRIRSSVLLYRTHGVFVTSDRFMSDEGQVERPAEDCVYYALTDTANHYLYSLPKDKRGVMLDMGAGSGVAALMLAAKAEKVYATDIAPRCVLFSEFNRQLNGIENVEVRQGSLYEPVEDTRFDLITCHPPFDMSLSSKKYIYADGGEDGEFVLRGLISGLPMMLKPGGQFIGSTRATDRRDGNIEERMRQWLGDAHAEFDIAVIVRSVIKPEEHAISASMLAKQNLDDYQMYMDHFGRLGATRLPYVHILIERKAAEQPLTLRRDIGMRCTWAEMESLLAWERVKPTISLAGTRLSAAPHMELHVRHKLKNGEVTPIEYAFAIEHPFREQTPVPEWVAKLAALCIADRTTEQVYALMREEYPIPLGDFESALKRLVSMGVLQVASVGSPAASN